MKTYLSDLFETICPFLLIAILSASLGGLFGALCGQSLTRDIAVESGCAQFDSTNGDFKWKTLK